MTGGPKHPGPRVVHADNAGPFAVGGTRTHLVGRGVVAIVDPGPPDPSHLRRLVEAVSGARAVQVLVTHGHPDHDGGTAALVRLLSGARGAGRGFEGTLAVAGHSGHPPTEDLPDGARTPTDAGTLVALETPGHARRHLAFFHEETGDLYPGDLVLGSGRTAWVGSYGGCVADYLASMARLEALGAGRLFPAHGPPVEGADAVAAHLARFRAHRERRVEEVDAAVAALGPEAAVDALVDRVYGDAVAAGLREGARWSVRAILHHLGVRPFPDEGPGTVG